jgi:hypothetical protein
MEAEPENDRSWHKLEWSLEKIEGRRARSTRLPSIPLRGISADPTEGGQRFTPARGVGSDKGYIVQPPFNDVGVRCQDDTWRLHAVYT